MERVAGATTSITGGVKLAVAVEHATVTCHHSQAVMLEQACSIAEEPPSATSGMRDRVSY